MADELTQRVQQARDGDAEAWDTLFQRYQMPLYVYILEMIRDKPAAEDVVQQTFIKATRHIVSLRDDAKFGAWLFGIASQLCRQTWRRKPPPISLDDAVLAAEP